MQEPSPRQGYRGDVQGLRAVAVSLVVLGHAHVPGLSGGFVGVDVFFVISGFLITGLLLTEAARTGRVSLPHFYARRALRILPAATVVIVATAVAATQILNFMRVKEVLTDSIWTTLFAANIKFGRDGTDYFAFNQPVSPLQHFWSLAVEEQFYLVWPVVLAFALLALRGHRPEVRLALILLLVGGASLAVSVNLTATEPVAAYFSTFARAWELAVGAVLAVALPVVARLPSRIRAGLTWAGLAGVGVAATTFDASTPFPGSAAVLPVLATAAVLAGGVGAPRFGASTILGRQPFRFVGDISYSLYLWHWPLLVLGAEYAGHPLSVEHNLALMAVAVLLSCASYFGVENPLRHPRRSWQRRPRHAMLMWPAAVTSVLVVAMVAQPGESALARGVPGRTSVSAVNAVNNAVAAALRSAPIPANPAPGYSAVHDDFKTIGDCSGAHKLSNKICEFGDPAGSKRMVVFGNSHATMWLPALTPLAKSAHWKFTPIVKEACTYTDYVRVTKRKQCSQWYSWAKESVRRLHPDLIVFPVYVVGDGWEAATQQVVADLRKLKTRVLVLTDAPGIGGSPLDCLLRRQASLRSCLWSQDPVHIRADRATRLIAQRAGAEFLDVGPWFCARKLCPSVIGDVLPYIDKQHITATYARALVPALRPVLKLDAARRS